jgi:transcriptional regulatory protein GAL4
MATSQTQDTRTGSSSVLPLGSGDQACNECKRRKGRCDRQLPECGPCARNKRHCLYERHSKTPLTRRYLTEVEARLRQTEIRLRDAEQRAALAEAQLQITQHPQSSGPLGQSASVEAQGANGVDFSAIYDNAASSASPNSYLHTQVAESDSILALQPTNANSIGPVHSQQATGTNDYSQTTYQSAENLAPSELEQPPSGLEDFSWDEQSAGDDLEHAGRSVDEDADSPGVTDSMASLSVDDKRSGYLGIASGAAMLRLLMPDAEHRPKRSTQRSHAHKHSITSNAGGLGWIPTPVFKERHIEEVDLDAAINSYFSLYHISYPIVCEPTFRAQYAQVIPRPNGKSWNALAYIVAAIGLFTTATEPVVRDLDLFEAAKANISIDSLETGNITLVQSLALISNYIQKRGKPNSGYNYLGLALHMAMGLGMHKEFQNWRIAPLQMEIRRRVWWALYNFYIGAAITFGRPLAWPANGIEVALPLNVDDRDLTHLSVNLPPPRPNLTTHSAIADQARFHLMTSEIYARVISLPFPSAQELLQMDDERISAWCAIWSVEEDKVEARFRLSRSVMDWRYRNLRIIMFRPFVIRKALQARARQRTPQVESANDVAIDRCLAEAKASITSINTFWSSGRRTCMASWYALYFLFQSSMIPSVCLRNDPTSTMAQDWREQLDIALSIMQSMFLLNPSSRECHEVVLRLCSNYLFNASGVPTSSPRFGMEPVEESPNTQIEGLYSMMWPGASTTEVDMLIENDSWNNFIADIPDDSHNLLDQDFEDFRFV